MSREFSKISPNFWGSQKTEAIPVPDFLDPRLLYFYLTTNPHANSSGCYDLKPGYAMTDLKCSEKDFRKAIQTLVKVGLLEIQDGYSTVFITNWVKHNEPTNAKHAIGILSQLQGATSPILKTKRAEEFKEISQRKNYLSDKQMGEALIKIFSDFGKPSDRVSPPRPDQDQTKTETRPEAPPEAAGESLKNELPEFVKTEWNKLAEKFTLSAVKDLNQTRRAGIMLRSADIKKFLFDHHGQDLDFPQAWENLFMLIERSPLLVAGSKNSDWRVTLDWLLLPRNLLKVMEGNYIEKPNGKTGSQATADAIRASVERLRKAAGHGPAH